MLAEASCWDRCKDLHAGVTRQGVRDGGHSAVGKRPVSGMAKEPKKAD